MTVIEVAGAYSGNLGSRLMLHSVATELRRASPPVELAVWGGTVGPDDVWANRLHRVVTDRARAGPRWSLLAAPLRLGGRSGAELRQAHGLVSPSELDGLVDISGFALSDQRGPARAEQYARLVESHAAAGRPVVLLPQSFGPFDDPAVAAPSARAVRAADLVVARDGRSVEHLDSLGVDGTTVMRSPDITFGVAVPARRAAGGGVVLLVPNRRVVTDRRTSWTHDTYVRALAAAADAAAAGGRRVGVLLHSAEQGDADIADAVVRAAGVRVERIAPAAPVAAKEHLAAADAVVASRYHAAVGALSAGVPTVVVGWSHKYAELLADLGLPELLVTDESASGVGERLRAVIDDPGLRANVGAAADEASAEVGRVWKRTREVLRLSTTDRAGTT